jgi:hypothetical protein
MTERHDIVTCARQFLDVRFVHQGRSREGLDCLGLLIATAREAGLDFEAMPVTEIDVPTYGRRPDTQFLKAQLDRFLTPILPSALAPADIVLLKVEGSPQHLAIISDYPMAGELGMIHAYAPAHKVVEHRYDAIWRRNTYACYRLPQL